MGNVKFIYLYRDGANYKSWSEVIFSNPDRLPLCKIEKSLLSSLLPDKLFVASQISIPEKFLFLMGDFSIFDYCYHEFDQVEICKEKPTDRLKRSIKVFLKEVQLVSEQGWKAFAILEHTQRHGHNREFC